MSRSDSYPTRPQFWSNSFCRLLTKSAAAQYLGPECCWLLAVIVQQEDVTRYKRAVTFWNEQLLPLCGFSSRKRLETARSKAVKAGFLHYIPGGKSRPGQYWVIVPKSLQGVTDGPVCENEVLRDESLQEKAPQSVSREDSGQVSVPQSAHKRHTKGNEPAHLSTLCPNPSPIPERSAQSNEELVKLIKGFNIVAAEFGIPKSDMPPSKTLVSKYQSAIKNRVVEAVLADVPKIADSIRDSEFVHGNGNFNLLGLLGKNRNGEYKLLKLLNGDYKNARSNRRQSLDRAGDRSRYANSDEGWNKTD